LTYFLAQKSNGIKIVESNHIDYARIINGGIMKRLNGIVQERHVTFDEFDFICDAGYINEARAIDLESLKLCCKKSNEGKRIVHMIRKYSSRLDEFCQRPTMKSLLLLKTNLGDLELVYDRFKSNSFTYLLIVGCMSVYDNSSRIYLIADLSLRMCFECIETIWFAGKEVLTDTMATILTEKYLIAILCRCFSNCLQELFPVASMQYDQELQFLAEFKNSNPEAELQAIDYSLHLRFMWV
jgi:hypothetical protein